MIHLLDTDPRQFSEPDNYKYNHGSLSSVMINLNNEFKKLNLFSDPDQAEWVGICDGLNVSFKYKDKKSFLISCWEVANALPLYHLQTARNCNQKLIGMSDQITNLWKKYGFSCETVRLGTDTEFWHPSKDKNKNQFTFILPLATFTRSAIDLTLEAFFLAFRNNKDVILKLKDTGSTDKYINIIQKYKNLGLNIEHESNRWSMQRLRDFYSEAHVCLTLQRAASFGLIITESMSCNTLNLTGNIEPFNEIVNSDVAVLLDKSDLIPISKVTDNLVNNWGFMNTYGSFEYLEEPMFYNYNIEEYANKMLYIYNNWDKFSSIDYRKHIVDNYKWEYSALKLKDILKI